MYIAYSLPQIVEDFVDGRILPSLNSGSRSMRRDESGGDEANIVSLLVSNTFSVSC